MNRQDMMKRLLLIFFLALSLLSGCGGYSSKPHSTTLMVYLCGSDLETEAGTASLDIAEMCSALREEEDLEIFVLAGGAKEWRTDEIEPDGTNIYRLGPDSITVVEKNPLLNMGSPETFLRLLEYGYENSRTDRYALLFWDHGAGPMFGLCFDQNFPDGNSYDCLTLDEIAGALGRSPFAERKLDWIGMDACLMASVETAWTLSPYADYLIASQETEPATGWDYSFLEGISQDPAVTDTARRAAEKYINSQPGTMAELTLSCIDLSKAEDLAGAMSDVFEKIDITEQSYRTYAGARADTRTIGHRTPYNYDLVDFGGWLTNLDAKGITEAESLKSRMEEAVAVSMSNCEGFSGLSIYYPFYNKLRYTSPWSQQYQSMPGSKGYQDFVRSFGRIWMSESFADWNSGGPLEAEGSGPGKLFLKLSREQADNLAKARLVVIDENGPGQFYSTYYSDDVKLSEGGILYCDYHNEALYFTDDGHTPKTAAVSYRQLGDCIAVVGMVYNLSESINAGKPVVPEGHNHTYLIYSADKDGNLVLTDFMELDPDTMLFGKSTLNVNDWDMVVCLSTARSMPEDENGYRPPFSEWELAQANYGFEEKVKELGTPVFLPRQDDSDRYAFFEITDLQGNVYASEPTLISSTYRQEIPVETPVLADGEIAGITLESITAVNAAQPGLRLCLEVENRTDRTLRIRFHKFMADGVLIHRNESMELMDSCIVAAHEKKLEEIEIPASALSGREKDIINSLQFSISYQELSASDYTSLSEEMPLVGEAVEVPLHMDLSGIVH